MGFTAIQIPTQQGKKNSFIEGEIKVGRATLNRVHGFSLSESLPGKRNVSSFCWVGEGNGNLLHPVFLSGESCGQGILMGCRPWDCTESDTTEGT